jgi:LysM repeat protein
MARSMAISIFLAVCAVFFPQNVTGIEHDENNMIFLYREKNQDSSISDKLVLTKEHVNDVIQYIQEKFPNFDVEADYDISDLSIAAFVEEFNKDGPEYCIIYMPGIEEHAGYSSVISWLNGYLDRDDPKLYSFHFFLDEEYSDTSGIMFSDFFSETENSESLHLWRKRYRDVDDYYWEVIWPFDIRYVDENDFEIVQLYTKEEKTEILLTFLTGLIDTKVFQNIDLTWFGRVYTGIEEDRQRISNLLWEILKEYDYDDTENDVKDKDRDLDRDKDKDSDYDRQTIANLQWLNGDKTTTELTAGAAVTVYAQTKDVKDGETVTITIWSKSGETETNIGEYPSRVKDNTIRFHWASPQDPGSYYYTVRYNTVTSQPSALLNTGAYKPATADRPAYYIVKKNDSLWNIAAHSFIYGNPFAWKTLYEANKHNFVDDHNSNLIEPGQVLIIPSIGNETRTGTR